MQWDLTRLYQSFSDPNFSADLSAAEALTEQLSAALSAPSDDHRSKLRSLIEMLNRLESMTARLGSMVMLTLSVDAENAEALAVHDQMQTFYVRLKQQYSAFNRYVGSLDCLEALIEQDELIREHAFVLRETAKEASHTIDPALEETVLKLRITGSGAWSQLRGTLESTLTVDYEENGEKKQLPLAAARNLAYSADADTRRRAYEAELAAYSKIEIPMAACLSGMKGEALTMLPLRRYESLLDQTLEQSRMDRETLDAMLTAMRESFPAFRRYLRAKAKAFGP